MALLISKGHICDPATGIDGVGDLLITNGKVRAVGKVDRKLVDTVAEQEAVHRLDAKGLIVSPGWVDMHAHLREPGNEHAETIRTGALAAAAGGFTTVACLPDTRPPIDSESATEFVRLQSDRAGGADVYPICALTKGCEGKHLAELGQLTKAGAVAFSDSRPLERSDQLLKGLRYARMFGRTVIDIPRDASLGSGVMNAGLSATLAGLSGSPAVAEELAVVRGWLLARESRGAYHAAQISTIGAVRQMRAAKADGIGISCAVAPHNLLFTEEVVRERYDTRYKLRPPFRTSADIEALIGAVRDGTLDCVVSAHAPVENERKNVEFDVAPFGGSMLEAALSATLEALVHRSGIPLARVIAMASLRPAQLLGMQGRKGTLAPGADGDVTLIDLHRVHKINSSTFLSKSQVCPFDGMALRGSVHATVLRGTVFVPSGKQEQV